jgi:hypothetical protein
MRSIRVLAAAALFIVVAVPLFASCTFPLTVTNIDPSNGVFRLSWQTVFGAKQYEVQASLDNFKRTTSLGTLDSSVNGMNVTQKTSRIFNGYSYRVVASNPDDPRDIQCSGTTTVSFFGAARGYQVLAYKTVIPVVGSTRGNNNAQFKTSLRIGPGTATGGFSAFRSGTIIFHPAGRPGSANDPSLTFKIERGEIVEYDDIVAAMGQSGIGSLDIVPFSLLPSTDALPVEVRLFNQAPEGTYGGFEAAVQPADVFRPADWTVEVPSSRFRVNIGVRTITATHATFFHVSSSGAMTQKFMDLAADFVFMQAADQFFGVPMGQGDTIVIHFDTPDTIAIPFHTFTDNSTNDPSIFNLQSPARLFYADIEAVSATP